jgi:hypothetical protein
VQQAVVVHRVVTNKGTQDVKEGMRFYVSSKPMTEAGLSEQAQTSRRHWVVENNIHWVRDAVDKEDASRIRNTRTACALSLLGTALLAPVRAAGHTSPTEAKESFAVNYASAIAILLHQRLSPL